MADGVARSGGAATPLMSHQRKSLPLITQGPVDDDGPLHLESARRRLGGRAATGPGAGRVVSVAGRDGATVPGVVLYASETELDVWIDDRRVRRTRPDAVTPYDAPVPPAVAQVVADASVFAALAEGQRVVHPDRAGAATHGTLVEKCRYGALVAGDDGTVRAVGFRRLWPAPSDHAPS